MTTRNDGCAATIAGFGATLDRMVVDADEIALWRVADLERHVDRQSLLAAEDAAEPPYWAHLWSGAVVLAHAVPHDAGTVVEIGCGLGLPGLVAARRGARVTFVDRVAAPLAFVRGSARASGLGATACVVADAAVPPVGVGFDLVLAAELLYDRTTLVSLAGALQHWLAPGARALLADARRINTAPFYAALGAAGLRWRAIEHAVREEGLPLIVRLVEIARA